MNDYQKVIATLCASYNQEKAKQRNQSRKEDWKIAERQQFLTLLQKEDKIHLLHKLNKDLNLFNAKCFT